MGDQTEPLDPFERAKLRAMIIGYHARWIDEEIEVLFVEREFRVPLVNPETGAASRTFEIGGKLDAGCRRGPQIRERTTWTIVEHKSTSEDIGLDSQYWKRLRIDQQVSNYYTGGDSFEEYGRPIDCLYDVVRKPAQRPLTKTANPKHKANGELYANQRADDETPDEFEARCLQAIYDEPDKYYQRGSVVRLPEDDRLAKWDVWHQSRDIRETEVRGIATRNPDACVRWGKTCSYFEVCTGSASLDDKSLFRREARHVELDDTESTDGKRRLPLVTTSELKAFRRCKREHEISYRLGYREIEKSGPLRMGTAMHHALEVWWRTCGNLSAALMAIDFGVNVALQDASAIELHAAQNPALTQADPMAETIAKLEASIKAATVTS